MLKLVAKLIWSQLHSSASCLLPHPLHTLCVLLSGPRSQEHIWLHRPIFSHAPLRARINNKFPKNTIAIAFSCHYANTMQFNVIRLSPLARSPRSNCVVCTNRLGKYSTMSSLRVRHFLAALLSSSGIEVFGGLCALPMNRNKRHHQKKRSSYRN